MSTRYPFKFLNAYDSTDTDIFFGRDDEVEQLYEMVFQTEILLVYGGSGTGKTSLINCGLASKFQSHDWLAINVRRGRNINESLKEKLDAAVGQQVPATRGFDWLEDEDEEEDSPKQVLSPLQAQFRDIYLQHFKPIYLIFDQFEELFVIGEKQEQAEFIQTVKEVLSVDQPVKMIFIIREEYLGHLFDFERQVPELLRKKLRVEPMNLEKVRQVILGAASIPNTNIKLKKGEEDQIAEGIFSKIKGEKKSLTIQLPYMQVFLDKFFLHITGDKKRQAKALFSMEALAEIGDISDVLRDFLEEQVFEIQQGLKGQYTQLPDDAVWQILSPFVTLDGTKEPLGLATLYQRVPKLPQAAVKDSVQALENRRILRFEENEGLYEVAHDSLAMRIAERRSDEEIALLEIRRMIKGQISLKEEARAPFTENQLNFIQPFMDKLALTSEEQQLIDQSWEKVNAEKEEVKRQAEAERQRLLERQALLEENAKKEEERRLLLEKNARTQKRFIGWLIGVAVVMIAVAIWAVLAQISGNNNYELAQSRLQEIRKEQVLSVAQELKSYGDAYKDLGKSKFGFACDSYNAGLDSLRTLENYESIPLFQELIEDKKEAQCDE